MRRKSHAAKVAAKQTRLVLRRRILRVLERAGTYEVNEMPQLRTDVVRRVAALLREFSDT